MMSANALLSLRSQRRICSALPIQHRRAPRSKSLSPREADERARRLALWVPGMRWLPRQRLRSPAPCREKTPLICEAVGRN
eukprot:4242202-Prymnesium_polylepis.1